MYDKVTKSELSIAIHNGEGWNARWRQYCIDHNIPHTVVNCYDSDILEQIRDYDILMWAFHHLKPTDLMMARHVLYAANNLGLVTYPDFQSSWHFDDKIAQKYLFESLDLPAVQSWIFYDKNDALQWIEKHPEYIPIVAKLKAGAGSYNVKLLRSKNDVKKYVNTLFEKGVSPTPSALADAPNKFLVAYTQGGLLGILNRLKKAPKFVRMVNEGKKYQSLEKGYVYFQEFVPDNQCDYRISVVDGKVWGFRRFARPNDFRASGSGMIDYNPENIPLSLVKLASDCAKKLDMTSVCFDFVVDKNNHFQFVEISYGFMGQPIYDCPGYWDQQQNWHSGHYWPEHFVIESILKLVRNNRAL